jgi:copper chaperone CopZ
MKDVKTQIEKLDGNIVKIEVTVDSKAAKDAYDKILK